VASPTELKLALESMLPAIEGSLDAVCVVNHASEIVYLNGPMRTLLKLRPSAQDGAVKFCDTVKLSICGESCQIAASIKDAKTARFEEIPASRGDEKLRVTLKVAPLGEPSIGALITLRDVTGDFLLQAKYHKTLGVLEEKDHKISELETQVTSLKAALKRARHSALE
jgi:hypothetical protein